MTKLTSTQAAYTRRALRVDSLRGMTREQAQHAADWLTVNRLDLAAEATWNSESPAQSNASEGRASRCIIATISKLRNR